MTYELIAFDMDGTLLDSRKQILPSSTVAIGEAFRAGKTVTICSGRCPTLLAPYASDLPHVRYAICGNGTLVYDMAQDEVISESALDRPLVESIAWAIDGEDVMVDLFSGRGFFYQASFLDRMDRYFMGVYQGTYRDLGTPVPDIRETLLDPGIPILKLNAHFTSTEARERVRGRLAGLPLEIIDSETSSLEFSPSGVNKGTGLIGLAEHLGITREATICVGDADNDLPMLRAAGLAVAMGNANAHARAAADVIVADNDHDGCAEAIRRYLLGSEPARNRSDG